MNEVEWIDLLCTRCVPQRISIQVRNIEATTITETIFIYISMVSSELWKRR